MRAVTLTRGELAVADLPEPQPGPGQLLLAVQRCGICGSDLHARHHGDDMADVLEVTGYDRYFRSHEPVVLGHEVLGTVVGHGPGTRRPGTRGALAEGESVVALPLVRRDGQLDALGLSAHAPGGYAERVVVQEAMTMPVPAGTDPDVAALTEPLAVAWHAVARGQVARGDVAVVIGAGPVGLAVVAVLKARGVATIIVSDPSAGRRALAAKVGAHVVLDPTEGSPFAGAREHGHLTSMTAQSTAGMEAMEGLRRLPVPWWRAWRALAALGRTTPKAPVVFECVGLPGMIERLLADVPLHTRIVVAGVCMSADSFRPAVAVNKEVDLRFVVGYTPLEFRDSLHALAEGRVDLSPVVTGTVGLGGVDAAFGALEDAESHAKILIDPSLTTGSVRT